MDIENFQESMMDKMASALNNKLEEIFIEGLRLKGYDFNKNELVQFIKKHVTSIGIENETIYYVDNIPFLLYNCNNKLNYDFSIEPRIFVDYGSYSYL